MNISRKAVLLSMASIALLVRANVNSHENHETEATKAHDHKTTVVAEIAPAPARQANIDPKTGELSSKSVSEIPSAAQTIRAERPPIKYITHPDGTVEGDLNGWFQSNLNVTVGCDGELNTKHSDQPAESHSQCVESE